MPNASQIDRYVAPSTTVAVCHLRRPSASRANSNTSGSADGSIIAAIITVQLAAKAPRLPGSIAIPSVDRDR